MLLELVQQWHARARPAPSDRDLAVQLGCHFEELAEMIQGMKLIESSSFQDGAGEVAHLLATLGNAMKKGDIYVAIHDRKAVLDGIADQVVTAVGVAHCAGMNGVEAVERVNSSNWSKFDDDGQPIFTPEGKVTKGPKYAPPDLEGLY